MDCIDSETFSPSEFCRTLLSDTKEREGAELVAGGDAKQNTTTTLNECSVDLTEAAINGELDDVFGRAKELMACL